MLIVHCPSPATATAVLFRETILFTMLKHSSSPSTPSALSATEDYKPPTASALAALLTEDTSVPSHEVEFNSRESTPFVMEIPPGVHDWRSDAQAARRELEEVFGKSAATRIRQSISYSYYWQIEANHFSEYWELITGKLSEEFNRLRSATTNNIRDMIADRQYWEIEVMQYRRYVCRPHRKYAAVHKREPVMRSSQRPGGIRKRKTDPQSTSIVTSKDAPVSSRTRGKGRIRKKVVKPKST